jgi:neopullulanase
LQALRNAFAAAAIAPSPAAAQAFRDRAPTEEVIYFVLPDRFENGDRGNDRGGIKGGRLDHGFDPVAQGFLPWRGSEGPNPTA